jgi:UDP-glucose:(heptosyl)LPS alpha-1,3-glucosyltransferase
MKIGVIRQRYTAIGGAERYLDGVIRELVARGHDVHVFANSWPSDSKGFTFHRVPMVRVTSFLKVLSFAVSATTAVRQARCELVFSLERTLDQDVYRAGDGCHREWLRQRARFVSPLKKLNILLNPLHQTLLAIERATFSPRCTGRIIANSHRGKKEIVELYGYPAERIDVIHNGVDTGRFKPGKERLPGDRVTLLFAGTGWERKGLAFAIRALASLPLHVRLRVAGKGNVSQYQALARTVGVAQRVEFVGANEDIAEVYQQADLLVHPAIYEPFANVCLEALACGLPVITSAANGASEIIAEGKNGAVVEHPEQSAALAGAIGPFLDYGRRAEASRAARATAEAHGWEAHITETLRILTLSLVEKSNRE